MMNSNRWPTAQPGLRSSDEEVDVNGTCRVTFQTAIDRLPKLPDVDRFDVGRTLKQSNPVFLKKRLIFCVFEFSRHIGFEVVHSCSGADSLNDPQYRRHRDDCGQEQQHGYLGHFDVLQLSVCGMDEKGATRDGTPPHEANGLTATRRCSVIALMRSEVWHLWFTDSCSIGRCSTAEVIVPAIESDGMLFVFQVRVVLYRCMQIMTVLIKNIIDVLLFIPIRASSGLIYHRESCHPRCRRGGNPLRRYQ